MNSRRKTQTHVGIFAQIAASQDAMNQIGYSFNHLLGGIEFNVRE
ncbi:MAG TPA: hypothetical protein VE862_05870 [Candidatus Acidoferrum sp.]|nr:hypothetical protein [Candidatus Acidoferrum sp.]